MYDQYLRWILSVVYLLNHLYMTLFSLADATDQSHTVTSYERSMKEKKEITENDYV